MNYTTVFECIDVNISTLISISVVTIVILAAIAVGAFFWLKHASKKDTSSKIIKYNLIIGIIGCVIAIVSTIPDIVEVPICKKNLYDEYISGNTLSVEGYAIVETYTDDNDIERIDNLTVKDIDFNTNSKYIYNYSEVHDLCIANKDYVRITYVSYKNKNFVMKIEKMNSTESGTVS